MVHNLELCYQDVLERHDDEKDDMRFVGFVNRVLGHKDAGWLYKFRLVWTPRCIAFASHASSWISTAISKNVHELFLCLETRPRFEFNFYNPDYYTFVMPISVFSCSTLRVLELDGCICVSESIVVCLPMLETIKLESIYFQSEEAFEKLIKGCPVLTNLCITMYGFLHDDFTYRISSTSLIRLEVDINSPKFLNMELETSSLEYIKLHGFIPVFLVKKSLSSLVEAKFDANFNQFPFSDVNVCNSVVEAVRVFHCAKALILSAPIIQALSCATICLSTEFKRLVKLESTTYSCACSSIRDFIECSSNLEVLTMNQIHILFGEMKHVPSNWAALLQATRCLSNSLKKVEIKCLYGLKDDELEMVRYMLKHGNALKDVEVSFDEYWSKRDLAKLELVREISEFSKTLSMKHPTCEVKFVGETSSVCNFKVL